MLRDTGRIVNAFFFSPQVRTHLFVIYISAHTSYKTPEEGAWMICFDDVQMLHGALAAISGSNSAVRGRCRCESPPTVATALTTSPPHESPSYAVSRPA